MTVDNAAQAGCPFNSDLPSPGVITARLHDPSVLLPLVNRPSEEGWEQDSDWLHRHNSALCSMWEGGGRKGGCDWLEGKFGGEPPAFTPRSIRKEPSYMCCVGVQKKKKKESCRGTVCAEPYQGERPRQVKWEPNRLQRARRRSASIRTRTRSLTRERAGGPGHCKLHIAWLLETCEQHRGVRRVWPVMHLYKSDH